jgi:hypothetical protein
MVARRSLIVIMSDCFDRLGPLTSALKQFRHAHHELVLFHIVAPEEEEFPFHRPTQFRNLERGSHRVLVDPHRLRSIYRKQYDTFCHSLESRCGSIGVDYHRITTAQPYGRALGAYIDSRARRRK